MDNVINKVVSHKDLIVWQKAMDLAVCIYAITKKFPRGEIYGMTSQITRAASSVPANITEGGARGAIRDYSRFLGIAKGS
jgi:four helix bundle protein